MGWGIGRVGNRVSGDRVCWGIGTGGFGKGWAGERDWRVKGEGLGIGGGGGELGDKDVSVRGRLGRRGLGDSDGMVGNRVGWG